eukprot:CAMPEP_0181486586 /NCGR_PEP_ID=MMETSP1110-20121109/47270_1 /TAXON_ID=174948 /ORGANISM="Symbiodinium sp., Strain CCMP421" /LENGTH=35 /DNA_ID= /DNA_START= /DNA_END= /DNA_ORIENTATION=
MAVVDHTKALEWLSEECHPALAETPDDVQMWHAQF